MTTRLFLAALAIPALTLAACHKSGEPAAADAATLKAAAAKPAPAGGWAAQVAETPEGGFRIGNPDAPVKIVEYGSRTCPTCQMFAMQGEPVVKARYVSTGKVSYEFRDFAIHAPDLANILLGRCNGASSYFPILEQMYATQPEILPKLEALPPGFEKQFEGKTPNQQAAIWADYMGYKTFVGQRGVPAAKADACLADPQAVDRLSNQMNAGVKTYNVSFTPFFIINDQPQGQDATTWKALEPRIRAALGA